MRHPIPQSYKGARLRWSWQYLDRDGETVLGIVARYDHADGKHVVPYFNHDGDGWKAGQARDEGRPLYGLDTLKYEGTIYVVEGEKCATALHRLGLAAVASPGGSNAADKANWKPLDGRERVYILPDNDEPGHKYCDAVAGIVGALPHTPEVFRVELPDLPHAGDVVDWLQQRVSGWDGYGLIPREPGDDLLDEFLGAVTENSALIALRHGDNGDKMVPTPLLDLEVAVDYPLESLGETLGGAAMAIHESVQAPLAMCANAILAAAAMATQPHADVHVYGIGRRPISDYFLTIGESGERKSAVDRLALDPVRVYERELRFAAADDHSTYVAEQFAWVTAVKQARSRCKGNREALIEAMVEIGPEPIAPLLPLRVVSDLTIEGLQQQLTGGWPALGIFTDEGGTILGGHAMQRENLLHTLTGLSELWDGKTLSRVRKGDGASVLAGKRASLHLMMQPKVAGTLLDNEMAEGQGFLSRCLLVWPESTAGQRFYKKMDAHSHPCMRRYRERISELLRLDPAFFIGTRELDPYPLEVREGPAFDTWVRFHDEIEAGIGSEGEFRPVKGLAGKTAEHAARLAGILAVFEGGDLDEACMQRGCQLAHFYLMEAKRVKGIAKDSVERERAERLRRWLKGRHGGVEFSLRDVLRNAPRELRDEATALDALRMLESHGWVIAIPEKRRHWRFFAQSMVA